MHDTISNYRQIRLVITPGRVRPDQSYWCLHAVVVKKGVPYATALCDGWLPQLGQNCSYSDIIEAIEQIAGSFGTEQ